MSDPGNGRRPASRGRRNLVADKRAAKTPAKRKPATPKSGGSGSGAAKRRRAPARAKPQRRGPLQWLSALVRWIWRLIWSVTWRASAVVFLILALATGYYYSQLPDFTALVDGRARGSVTMLDRNGEVFAWRGDQFGGIVTVETASPHLINAVVATEDRRFYRHFGISPRGIASAVRINLSEGRGPLEGHGGSTITQQVAKLMCLGVSYDPEAWASEAEYEADCRRTTLWRKIVEMPFSFAMELRYSKDEVLAVYLNRAYFGAGAYGAEAASQRYFGHAAAEITPQEGAMLAGLLTAPSRFAPTANLERSQGRAATILRLMNEQGYLTAEETVFAQQNPATLSDSARQISGGAFADWIMQTGPDFLTGETTEDVVIRTTFDPEMQAAAEAALVDVFENQVREGSEAQAAIVVMSADGAVRAIVGGRDTQGAGLFNRATQAMRQTGSAFKPFVYATALDLGRVYDDLILDGPLTIDVPGSGPYSPVNYGGEYFGDVTLTEAFARSLNTPAVRLSEDIGRDLVRTVAAQFGIESDLAEGPALALGASESSLMEMTGAYAGILNGGSAVRPYAVQELFLVGDSEPLFAQFSGIQERVISDTAARQLTYMMSEVTANGTGRRAALPDREVAGKTGTTQAARDAWFVGFTADYVAGVWMGYDNNTPLTGTTGGGLPAEIWRQTMARIHADLPVRPLPMIDPSTETRPPPPGLEPQDGTGARPAPDLAEQVLMEVLGALGARDR